MSSGGFDEGVQRGLAPADPVELTRFMLDAYRYRCAVTGRTFPRAPSLPHSDLDVFLLQPLAHKGPLAPFNAVVVERSVARLLEAGIVLIDDHYQAYMPDPVRAHLLPGMDSAPKRLHLPDDPVFWPSRDMLAYHRSLFRTQ